MSPANQEVDKRTVDLIRKVNRVDGRRRSEVLGLSGWRAMGSDYGWAVVMEMLRYGVPGRRVLRWVLARIENCW